MQPIMVISALKRISAPAVNIHARAAGDKKSNPVAMFVELALDPGFPRAPFVDFIQNHQRLAAGPASGADFPSVFAVVPVEVAAGALFGQQLLRERGLANLPRPGKEHHFVRKVLLDGVVKITGIYGESGVNLQVGSVDDETRKATTIANSGSPDQARFSPDGRWIAFNAFESGTVAGTEQCQVFVSAYPPRGAPQRITDHGGVQPIWREDGRELYYLDPAGNLMAIPVVQTEPNFGVGAPRLLFKTGLKKVSGEVEDYAVAGNGKRFLVKLPTEGETQAGFPIVLNWPALLAGAK